MEGNTELGTTIYVGTTGGRGNYIFGDNEACSGGNICQGST